MERMGDLQRYRVSNTHAHEPSWHRLALGPGRDQSGSSQHGGNASQLVGVRDFVQKSRRKPKSYILRFLAPV
eukprot:549652-Prymnesium_polylepis.6